MDQGLGLRIFASDLGCRGGGFRPKTLIKADVQEGVRVSGYGFRVQGAMFNVRGRFFDLHIEAR